jgi:hypothetical protein
MRILYYIIRREEIFFLNLFLVKDKEEKSGEKIEKIFFIE